MTNKILLHVPHIKKINENRKKESSDKIKLGQKMICEDKYELSGVESRFLWDGEKGE